MERMQLLTGPNWKNNKVNYEDHLVLVSMGHDRGNLILKGVLADGHWYTKFSIDPEGWAAKNLIEYEEPRVS